MLPLGSYYDTAAFASPNGSEHKCLDSFLCNEIFHMRSRNLKSKKMSGQHLTNCFTDTDI